MSKKIVQVTGGNLFRIAAEVYGDATYWIYIAQANKLSSPVITGLTTLVLPDPQDFISGGKPIV